MKRPTFLLLLIVMLLGLVVMELACVPAPTPAPQPAVAELTGHLRLSHNYTQPERVEAMKALVESFQAQNPKVTVDIEVVPFGEFPTKWQADLAAGTLPDVMTASETLVLAMYDAGAIRPMDDVLEELGGPDFFVETTIQSKFYKGHYVALPHYVASRVLYYRKDLMKGLAPPKTWNELMEVATELTEPPDRYGFAIPLGKNALPTVYLWVLTRQLGGKFFDADGQPVLGSPENKPKVIKAAEYLRELSDKASPPGQAEADAGTLDTLFFQGKSVFHIESGFSLWFMEDRAPEIASPDVIGAIHFPIPEGGEKASLVSGVTLTISKTTKNLEAAKALVEWMYQDENYIKFLHTIPGGMMPVTESVAGSEVYYDHPHIKRWESAIKVLVEAVGTGMPLGWESGPTPNSAVLLAGPVDEMVQKIILQNVPVEQAIDEAQEALEELVAEITK